jgi:hypothetical protein
MRDKEEGRTDGTRRNKCSKHEQERKERMRRTLWEETSILYNRLGDVGIVWMRPEDK